jgi:hypothetical protein
MRGEGPLANMVAQQYRKFGKLYGLNSEKWELDSKKFRRPGQQTSLF